MPFKKIRGTRFDDVIDANGARDALFGLAGDDQLFGDRKKDKLFGGAGDDILFGGPGDDILFGGAGADTLYSGAGGGDLFGGRGADKLVYDGGESVHMEGGAGRDSFLYVLGKGGGVENNMMMIDDFQFGKDKIKFDNKNTKGRKSGIDSLLVSQADTDGDGDEDDMLLQFFDDDSPNGDAIDGVIAVANALATGAISVEQLSVMLFFSIAGDSIIFA